VEVVVENGKEEVRTTWSPAPLGNLDTTIGEEGLA
jgi:hypothetical protein